MRISDRDREASKVAGGVIGTYLCLAAVMRLYKVYKATKRANQERSKPMFDISTWFAPDKAQQPRSEAKAGVEGERDEGSDEAAEGTKVLEQMLDDLMDWHGAKVEGNFGL